MNHKNEWTRWSIENKNSIFSKLFLLPISLVLLVDSRVTVARRVITDQLTLQFELGDDGLIIVDESRATWKVVGWLVGYKTAPTHMDRDGDDDNNKGGELLE